AGPAGWGALVTTASLVSLAGIGLARGRLVRGGGFLGGAILWVALLVGLFIVYPVVAMLHASVASGGRLTAGYLIPTLPSPVFLLLAHETLPRPAAAVALTGAVFGGLLGLGWGAVKHRSVGRMARLALMLAAIGAAVGLLLGARGALRNSLLLAVAVGL